MSCDCNTTTSSSSEGCNPLPVVSRGSRSIARGPDGCPVELSGSGVITQSPATGVYAADGSSTYPMCLGDIQQASEVGAILGVEISDIGGIKSCVFKIQGEAEDQGKVLKWTGTKFALRSLLETICWDSDLINTTCCATDGLAVFAVQGDSVCLQRWDPCDTQNASNPENPRFIACEDDKLIAFNFCDLPEMEPETEYSTVVCTEAGPRLLGNTGGVSALRFIPIDLVAGASPNIRNGAPFVPGMGNSTAENIDLAAETGAAIPAGATHVMVRFIITSDNEDDAGSADFRLYSPGAATGANLKSIIFAGDNDESEGSDTVTFNVPIVDGEFSYLITKSGVSSIWIVNRYLFIEGYWVG